MPEAPPGRQRYILTRPCLTAGSLTVGRYLAHILPSEGEMVFVGDGGEEIHARSDSSQNRITGLSDYYARYKLSVNDVLYITGLGERRFQLEHEVRRRDNAAGRDETLTSRYQPPAAPQRVVEAENAFVREIRTRPATPPAANTSGNSAMLGSLADAKSSSPYPNGIAPNGVAPSGLVPAPVNVNSSNDSAETARAEESHRRPRPAIETIATRLPEPALVMAETTSPERSHNTAGNAAGHTGHGQPSAEYNQPTLNPPATPLGLSEGAGTSASANQQSNSGAQGGAGNGTINGTGNSAGNGATSGRGKTAFIPLLPAGQSLGHAKTSALNLSSLSTTPTSPSPMPASPNPLGLAAGGQVGKAAAAPTPSPPPVSESAAPPSEARTPLTLPSDPTEAAELVFQALGYGVQFTRDRDLILDAPLGSRGYRVLLAQLKKEGASTKLMPSRWKVLLEAKKVWGAKYLALLVIEGQSIPALPRELGNVTVLQTGLLAQLAQLTLFAPIGPLELEGYWNAGGLTETALASLSEQAKGEVGARGVFSSVVLWLAAKPAHSVVTLTEVLGQLVGGQTDRTAVLEALETLARAPFRALVKLNPDEYYIRQSVEVTLAGLSEYASGLRTRLRATVRN
jgi:hypothetical protein